VRREEIAIEKEQEEEDNSRGQQSSSGNKRPYNKIYLVINEGSK
jgi:hypothetical protein